jgi:hypothetical protein
MTSEQLRALAARLRTEQPSRQELEAALHTAADRLEAVQAYIERREHPDDWGVPCVYTDGLRTILTADTAPQEDRDE